MTKSMHLDGAAAVILPKHNKQNSAMHSGEGLSSGVLKACQHSVYKVSRPEADWSEGSEPAFLNMCLICWATMILFGHDIFSRHTRSPRRTHLDSFQNFWRPPQLRNPFSDFSVFTLLVDLPHGKISGFAKPQADPHANARAAR